MKKPRHSEYDSVYRRLQNFMQQGAYTDPTLTRRSLAEKLATNEKYLYYAVRKNLGVTVADYINDIRLEHACRLLAAPADYHTVEEAAALSGFGSRNTFYRHFRRRYGITPNEFRLQCADKEQQR